MKITSKKLFKIPYYFLVVGVASIGLLLLATLLPIPGNLKIKIVKSGSMEPTIKTGGVVFIREASSYKMGDVITFGADTKTQIPTTHRIIEERTEGSSKIFTTMGDANDAPDPKEVRAEDIRGKVIFSLPYAGYLLDFVKKPLGFLLLVGVPALIIIFEELINIWKEIKKIRRRKDGVISVNSEESIYKEGNVLDLRAKFEMKSKESLSLKRKDYSDFGFKAITIFILFSISLLGFGSIGNTVSYYNENEASFGNILQASGDFGGALVETTVLGKPNFAPSLSVVEEEGEVLGAEDQAEEDVVEEETPASEEVGAEENIPESEEVPSLEEIKSEPEAVVEEVEEESIPEPIIETVPEPAPVLEVVVE